MTDKLTAATWTPKGLWISRAGASGTKRRFESIRSGAVRVHEAALALEVYPQLLYRLITKGAVRSACRDGAVVIPVRELAMLRTAWKYTRPTTRMGVRA